MAELKIKLNELSELIESIKKNKTALDTSVASIKQPPQSKGIMVSTYVDKIHEISKLLDKYKELLEKDLTDFIAAKQKLEEMDQEMETLYDNV